jgi:hypothetical protein
VGLTRTVALSPSPLLWRLRFLGPLCQTKFGSRSLAMSIKKNILCLGGLACSRVSSKFYRQPVTGWQEQQQSAWQLLPEMP